MLSQDRSGIEAIRKSIDILINIWQKNKEQHPLLVEFALQHYKETFNPTDRLWLHFGLTSLYYAYFRDTAAVIGNLTKRGSQVSNKEVIKKLISKRGNLGDLERSAQRIVSSLRDWDLLVDTEQSYVYRARYRELITDNPELEVWLLQCAFIRKEIEQIPYDDLIRLPELFPFNIKVGLDFLRNNSQFSVYRAGGGIPIVTLES